MIGGGITAAHPRSIAVALAIRDAVDGGTLGREAVAPVAKGAAGFWRVAGRLKTFHGLLARGDGSSLPSLSILLVDSNLWARVARGARGSALALHTPAAPPGESVIVTSGAVLAALLDGHLAAEEALARGLMQVDGPGDAAGATRTAIMAALAKPERRAEAPDDTALVSTGSTDGGEVPSR